VATPLARRGSTAPQDQPCSTSSRFRPGFRLVVLGVALAAPLALLPATMSGAEPTITVGQAEAQLSALQAREGVAVEAFDAGRLAADAAHRRAIVAARQVSDAAARLAGLKRNASVFAAAAFTGGATDPLTGLLAGGSASTAVVIDRAANLDQIARSRTRQLVAIAAEQTRLSGLQRTAADRASDAASQVGKLAAAQKTVQALIDQQQGVLSRLRADQRRQLQAEQAAQQAAAERASRAATRVPLAANSGTGSGVLPSGSGVAQTVLAAAYSQRGKPYVYGAAGPDAYDCSGLVMWAFAQAGISLPHSAAAQYGYGTHIPPAQLQPGDIVFYEEGGGIGHDGIYVGNGMMIDANHTGSWVDVRPLYGGLIGGTRL
jgi:cell wall-associated NlpC family hydrolase